VGPILGTLFDTSLGFTATYFTFACLQLISGLYVAIVLPNSIDVESVATGARELLKSFWIFLKIPSVLLFIFASTVARANEGLTAVIQPLLERVMTLLKLSPLTSN